MTLREKLIKDAEQFCAGEGISVARLATIVVKDGKFFARLASGRDCTTTVYERFQAIFSDPAAWEEARSADRQRRGVGVAQQEETATDADGAAA